MIKIRMDKNTLFEQIYANLPLSARNEIVVVIDNEPLTWNAARIEVENNTEKGKQIVQKLSDMKIIQ